MKYKNQFLLAILLVWLTACSKVIIYEPSEAEVASFGNLYLPLAERGGVISAISNTGPDQKFLFGAYLGGPKAAASTIPVVFKIEEDLVAAYNTTHGTQFKIMPKESYQIEHLNNQVAAGTRSSQMVALTVKPGKHFNLFENYMLPVAIDRQATAFKVHDKNHILYFQFNAGYPRGEVPRSKVLSLGANWGMFITRGARGGIVLKKNNHDIVLYERNADSSFNAQPRVIGAFWDATESLYWVNDQSMLARNYPYWAGLFNFKINNDHGLEIVEPFWLGDFWDQFVLVPFKNYLLTIDRDGTLRRQPLYTSVNTAKTEIGSGFKDYKQVMSYGNYLLALDHNGKLWTYEMSAQAIPGARKLVGEGWDMYTQILVSNTDILGVDAKGDIYRYDFSPSGFYPLK